MNKKKPVPVNILLLLGFIYPLSNPGFATGLEITPTLYQFKYQEFDSLDRLLDTEEGALPGIKFGFTPDYKNGTFNTHFAFYGGTIDYDGRTQSGTPHKTDTIQELFNLGFTITPDRLNNSTRPIAFFLGVQYWHWDRDIQSRNNVQGLHEIYNWTEFEIGVRFKPNDNSNLSGFWLSASALYIFSPEMTLQLPSSEVDFDLGANTGFRIRGGKAWRYSEGFSGSFNLFVESWEFGRSNTVFTDDFIGQSAFLVEPRSESFHSGLEFSFKYEF